MLTALRIENFKAWRETGEIRLAPLTVIFGRNSAGKSSLTQFLMMLKQTIESPDRRRVLHLGDRNTPVDLGTPRDLLFDGGHERVLSFALSYSLPSRLTIRDPKSSWKGSADAVRFDARIGCGRTGRLRVLKMRYLLKDSGNETLSIGMNLEGQPAGNHGKGRYRLTAENYEPVRNVGRGRPLPAPDRFYGFPGEATAYYQNTAFLADTVLALESQFRRLFYVGPLRGYPERSYVWSSGEEPEHVGIRGERAIEALLAAHDLGIRLGPGKRGEPFQKIVARWLKDLGLIESFRARPIAKGRNEYEVLIRVRDGSREVNLTDTGFGLSQLLPVIIECFYVPPGSTVIFEQPEIHLHPAVQAGLADLFAEAVLARENGKDRDVQVIVESHSEYFLRRLQRRVAEERLSVDQVAVYFCEPDPSGSRIREIELDDYGNITNWPPGFFGNEMEDLLAMTDAAARRSGSGAQ